LCKGYRLIDNVGPLPSPSKLGDGSGVFITNMEGKEISGGYVGKILFVDLSIGEIKEEVLEEKMCRDFIGGYGIGARILYSQ
jgi:hypothetical protein